MSLCPLKIVLMIFFFETPLAMISMPIINRAIPSNLPTRAAPITGDAIIIRANTIGITPEAILNIFDQLRLVLFSIS